MANIKFRKEFSQTILYFDLEQGYQEVQHKMISVKLN